MGNLQFLLVPALLLIAGFLFCFYGKTLFKPMLFLFGFIAGIYLSLSCLAPFLNDQTVLLIITLGLGILFAFLTRFVYSAGVFLAGCMAVMLFLNSYGTAFGANEWNIFIKLLACAGGGLLAIFFQKVVISIVSAFVGSYAMIFGASWLFCFFRYKGEFATFRQYQDFFQKTNGGMSYSILLILVMLFAILGFLAQWKILSKKV